MAINNYLKVRHPGSKRTAEFFFDSRHVLSSQQANRAARMYAAEATDVAKAKDAEAEAAAISVFQHGVAGMGDLPCIGGCDLCAPRTGEDAEENESAAS